MKAAAKRKLAAITKLLPYVWFIFAAIFLASGVLAALNEDWGWVIFDLGAGLSYLVVAYHDRRKKARAYVFLIPECDGGHMIKRLEKWYASVGSYIQEGMVIATFTDHLSNKKYKVLAPTSGEVVRVYVSEGQYAVEGEILAVIQPRRKGR